MCPPSYLPKAKRCAAIKVVHVRAGEGSVIVDTPGQVLRVVRPDDRVV
jgi:hypothetical protein